MTLEANLYGYFLGGVALSVGDRLSAEAIRGDWNKSKEKKHMYKSLDFVLNTYEKDNFESLKKDPEFVDAFVQTREYFASRIENPAVPIKAVKPKKNTDSIFKKTFDYGKSMFTKEYWENEKINSLTLRQKLAGSFLVPLLMNIRYAYGGLKYGTASTSDIITEFGETVLEGPSMLLGLVVGKQINKGVDYINQRYDRKLSQVEKKILLNEDLKSALAQEISTNIPGLKIEKPKEQPKDEPQKPPEKKEPAYKGQEAVDRHNELVERMNKLSRSS